MIKAAIFDLDGVISDTQKLHSRVEVAIFRKYGIKKTEEEITNKYSGVPCRDFFKEVFDENNISVDISKVVREKQDLMLYQAKGKIMSMPGVKQLINKFSQKELDLAVASSSPSNFVILVLEELALKNKFKVVVTIEDVKNGKPDPEIFLLTAKKLRVKPEECFVIEDGRSGMLAAKRAGMKCIGLVKNRGNNDYPADILVESLKDIKLAELT